MKLNKEQLQAAAFSTGPSLVIAGAGTGKTKTLIQKVVNILNTGSIKDYEILMLTFSKKAVIEMRERLTAVIGNEKHVKTSTFHAFCYSILCKHEDIFVKQHEFTSLPEIIPQENSAQIIKDLAMENPHKYGGLPSQVIISAVNDRKIISKVKDENIRFELEKLAENYKAYKKQKNLIEFEEIINYTIALLKENDSIRREYSCKYKYILVDEFQDTSDNNFEFLNLILNHEKNFFAVGDDFQLIYSFRNSRIKYILHLKKYFPGLKTHKLKVNYRSRREIVKISNSFIKKNKLQTNKKLKSHKGSGGFVSKIPYANYENSEEILNKICSSLNPEESAAVLYRNNYLENHIASAMRNFPHVNFMTIHSSKGLEFDNVVIFGVDDSIIPSPWSQLEEERRLFYVAMTRAKERLFIMYNSSNMKKPLFISELES